MVAGAERAVEPEAVHAVVEPAAAEPLPAVAAKTFPDWSPTEYAGETQAQTGGMFSGGTALPKNRHVPERSCVACGAKMPKSQLVRIVRTGQGPIIVDISGRESGRGAYLCHIPECWDRALGKGALERSFKQALSTQDLGPVLTYYESDIAPPATAP